MRGGQTLIRYYLFGMNEKKEDIMSDSFDFTDQYNDRINAAYDLDLGDLAINPEAVKTWMKMLVENGLDPGEVLPKARAKYDPETKELFLTVPVYGDEDDKQRHLVFVLQNELWQVSLEGHVVQ